MLRIVTTKRLKELEDKVDTYAMQVHAYKTRLKWERNLDLTENRREHPYPSPYSVK